MKQHVAAIMAAYVRRNRLDPSALPEVIASVSRTLADLGKPETSPPARRDRPAVSVRRSVTDDAVICLDCGWKGKVLRRHLMSAHGLTVDDYRSRWKLPTDYPMVAKNYSARRSDLAKSLGLGRGRRRAR
jgi:predicted transcriptional regulator